jgi:flagellar biosynthesis protein FlhF
MQEAIQLIKQDLGPEAVIVSSYKVLAKGLLGLFSPRLLEVTAALDDNPEIKLPEIKLNVEVPPAQTATGTDNLVNKQTSWSKVQAEAPLKPTNQFPDMINRAGRKKNEGPAVQSLLYSQHIQTNAGPSDKSLVVEDTGNLPEGVTNSLFDAMVSNHVEESFDSDFDLSWRKKLLDMEIEEDIVEDLLAFVGNGHYLPESYKQDLLINLYKQIVQLLEPAYHSREYARVLTFIGPPGVGKTTTLAKLATRFSLNDGKKVAMVSVNIYRIGAVEQLKAFGDFLGVPVDMVMTPAELVKVLESHNDKDYILIDTVGRSAHNAGQILELKGFLDVVKEPREVFLVLSLTSKYRDLNRIARQFQKTGYNKLIFSKADETETYGAILNLICALGLPAAYLTYGQGIPDDISEAGPKTIAKLLLRGVDPDGIVATWN